MKLKQDFVLRQIADDHILVPVVGIDDKFQGIITLNETGVFIWEKIIAGMDRNQITDALVEEYDVRKDHARKNVNSFCDHLVELDILE